MFIQQTMFSAKLSAATVVIVEQHHQRLWFPWQGSRKAPQRRSNLLAAGTGRNSYKEKNTTLSSELQMFQGFQIIFIFVMGPFSH